MPGNEHMSLWAILFLLPDNLILNHFIQFRRCLTPKNDPGPSEFLLTAFSAAKKKCSEEK